MYSCFFVKKEKLVSKSPNDRRMADGRVENVQILFSDITESIDYIRRICKAKPEQVEYTYSVEEQRAA